MWPELGGLNGGRQLRFEPTLTSPLSVSTWCLPGTVVDRKVVDGRTYELIRHPLEGIDVEGWTDEPLLAREPDDDCARFVERTNLKFEVLDDDRTDAQLPTPSGFILNRFVPDGQQLPKVLAEASRSRKTLFIPVLRQAKLVCAGYRVGRLKRGSTTLTASPPPQADLLSLVYSISVTPSRLSLAGPTVVYRNKQSVTAGCAHTFQFVGANDRTLELIPSIKPVLSYHPDDVEVWYADQPSCLEHATIKQASTACQ